MNPWLENLSFVLGRLSAYAVGVLLAVAGFAKLGRRSDFAKVVAAYRILPAPVVPAFSFLLPILELSVGVLLLLAVQPRVIGYCAALLFAGFGIAVTRAMLAGPDARPDCGCFGKGGSVNWGVVGRNFCLTCLSVAAAELRAAVLLVAVGILVFIAVLRAQRSHAGPGEVSGWSPGR